MSKLPFETIALVELKEIRAVSAVFCFSPNENQVIILDTKSHAFKSTLTKAFILRAIDFSLSYLVQEFTVMNI